MSNVIVFVQRHGSDQAEELEIAVSATIAELLMVSKSGAISEELLIFIDEQEVPFERHLCLKDVGAKHGSRIHLTHCREVEVTVHYQELTAARRFPPGTHVRRVKHWAVHEFKLAEADAIEHVLQICGGPERPAGNTPLHTLLPHEACALCFDLVPETRVEG